MFKGTSSQVIKSSIPKDKLMSILEESLFSIGTINVTENGTIYISTTKFDGFAHTTEVSGTWKASGDRVSIEIESSMNLNALGWLILICFFPGGLLILLLPSFAKSGVANKLDLALNEVKNAITDWNKQIPNPIYTSHTSSQLPAAPPPPPTQRPIEICYHVLVNGTDLGEQNLDNMKVLIKTGNMTKDTMVWKQGMNGWQPASTIQELNELFI